MFWVTNDCTSGPKKYWESCVWSLAVRVEGPTIVSLSLLMKRWAEQWKEKGLECGVSCHPLLYLELQGEKLGFRLYHTRNHLGCLLKGPSWTKPFQINLESVSLVWGSGKHSCTDFTSDFDESNWATCVGESVFPGEQNDSTDNPHPTHKGNG